jgi:biopolymer transport protein ExbD
LTNKLLVTPDANSAVNVAQVNGATTSTAASGVQKVGIVGNAGATVDAASGATAATNSVLHGAAYNTTKPTPTSGQQVPVQTDAYSNVYVNSNPYPAVQLAQAVNNKVSAGAGTTLTNAFGSATVAGNSILCIGFEGIAAIPVFTDAQANTYVVAISSGAAAPGYSVAIASNIVGGTTDTITLTTSSGSASFSCYELKGAVSVGQAWDYAAAAQATSTSLVFAQQSAAIANDFVAVGVGMAAGTINATPSLAGAPSNLTTVDQSNTAPLGTAALAVYYSAHAKYKQFAHVYSGAYHCRLPRLTPQS